MSKNLLIILAYNESANIKSTVLEYKDIFNYILVINDSSTDNTQQILENLKSELKNLILINNNKNLGAGYSFQTAIDYVKKNLDDVDYITKIDGDGQFVKKDIILINKILEKYDCDYVKSNRFWEQGIDGKIPTIRYFGNSVASFLIKFISGQFKITDPLNGLCGFNKKFLSLISIPKTFKRYGYPFYINTLSIERKKQIIEIQNTVKYNIGEKSQLKAVTLLFKLTKFSIKYFLTNISNKLKESSLQISALLDLIFILSQIVCGYIVYKTFSIRFFDVEGLQSNWLILFVMIQLFSIFIVFKSKSIESKFRSKFFINLN